MTTLPDKLVSDLSNAYFKKKSFYDIRSQYLDSDKNPLYTNRLILEDSPYLLQHAHTPVNWYPWGKEAFELARRENKPVFLSIGYSTCHWCHVMEHESFDNEEIAAYLNQHFIAVKVDRETHPQVDEIYMSALQTMKGSGGWPMSHFLLENGKPFFTGTYFPADEFLSLLKTIKQSWQQDLPEIQKLASEISNKVDALASLKSNIETYDKTISKRLSSDFLPYYDSTWGGFGSAPKFPNEFSLLYLLHIATRYSNEELLSAVEHSLHMMAHGGIYDQIDGGFHRYSTDDYWLIPHFEKMLYNQANLARLYIQAYGVTQKPLFRRISTDTLDFVLNEMTSKEGFFYSAIDADSQGQEGSYYLWNLDDFDTLNNKEQSFLQQLYGITKKGNFNGNNVLFLPYTIEDFAKKEGLSLTATLKKLHKLRSQLQLIRKNRDMPFMDKKMIVSWNAMMISALSKATEILKNDKYLNAAIKAAEFIWNTQVSQKNSLSKIYFLGKPFETATQDDYAYLAESFIELYDVSNDPVWLDRAIKITEMMLDNFFDHKQDIFFLSHNSEHLFTRPKQLDDTILASGNSVAFRVLGRLGQRFTDHKYEKYALKLIHSIYREMISEPLSYPYFLLGFDEFHQGQLGEIEYMAHGKVKLSARLLDDTKKVFLDIQIASGWHINSHQPPIKELIPLDIRIDKGGIIVNQQYPEPEIQTLGFTNQPLSLYKGKVRVEMNIKPDTKVQTEVLNPMELTVQLQACNNEICQPPETATLELFH